MKNNIKVEEWLGNEIRFVEVNGEWQAVAKDITDALGFDRARDGIKKLDNRYKGGAKVPTLGGEQIVTTLTEKGMYRLIMRSNKKEAEEFQDWVFDIIGILRESANLTAFELLRKENQKLVTDKLRDGLEKAEPKHYRKANTIANKAVSTLYGFDKKLDLGDMPPEMQVDREPIFNDTVELMVLQERMNLDISISKTIYAKHCN